MLRPGDLIDLVVDKPAAGGRMIARLDGRVIFVAGAIPGERVSARVERVAKGLAYADTVRVATPSPDRRLDAGDLRCGGGLYAHIAYPRQLTLKSLVIADAFARLGHIELPSPVGVTGSREDGYRMRARLHVRRGVVGFFREGTHDLCDPRPTRQLLPATCDALERLGATMRFLGVATVRDVELSENIDASERVVHVDSDAIDPHLRDRLGSVEGFTPGPYVVDTLTLGETPMRFRRHVLSFFQGNRHLIGELVAHVTAQIPVGASVVDLYAGSGLFSLPAALVRRARVTAVEGDRTSAGDLDANAAAASGAVVAVHDDVEGFLARGDAGAADRVVIADPPRTGMSPAALAGVARLAPVRIVYVSCDVATLARDARRLVDAGYTMAAVDAFDMFPNTPHVETVAVFARGQA